MYDLLLSFFSKTNVNSIGLLFDVVGVLLIAYSFKNIRREKITASAWSPTGDKKEKMEKEHKKLLLIDRCGMAFLIVGFSLQIVSNYM